MPIAFISSPPSVARRACLSPGRILTIHETCLENSPSSHQSAACERERARRIVSTFAGCTLLVFLCSLSLAHSLFFLVWLWHGRRIRPCSSKLNSQRCKV